MYRVEMNRAEVSHSHSIRWAVIVAADLLIALCSKKPAAVEVEEYESCSQSPTLGIPHNFPTAELVGKLVNTRQYAVITWDITGWENLWETFPNPCDILKSLLAGDHNLNVLWIYILLLCCVLFCVKFSRSREWGASVQPPRSGYTTQQESCFHSSSEPSIIRDRRNPQLPSASRESSLSTSLSSSRPRPRLPPSRPSNKWVDQSFFKSSKRPSPARAHVDIAQPFPRCRHLVFNLDRRLPHITHELDIDISKTESSIPDHLLGRSFPTSLPPPPGSAHHRPHGLYIVKTE